MKVGFSAVVLPGVVIYLTAYIPIEWGSVLIVRYCLN